MTGASGPGRQAGPRVLLLCAQAMLTVSALYCLNGMGAEIVAVGDPWMGFLQSSRFCRRFEPCAVKETTPEALLARLEALLQAYPADVVVPADNDAQLQLARIGGALSVPVFPMPSPEALAELNDKQSFDTTCRAIGVPVPQAEFFADKGALDPEGLGARFGFPLIVKPTNWGGSDGVVLARSAEDLRRRVIEDPAYVFHPLVVQEFIPGRDVGFNVFALEGRTVLASAQTRVGEAVHYLDNDALIGFGKRYVEAVGLTGIANLDARVGPDGRITFFECNARIWASICHAHWCGANYVAAGVRHALGLPQVEAEPLAGRSVLSPARLMLQLARGQRAPWRLSRADRRALAQGAADPVLLLRRYHERRARAG